jgi:CRISPR-associated protein Cmr3
MHTLLIHPTDVLFFKDGRPMEGAASGHGSSWPLPHLLNSAFHGALHRADLEGAHGHDHHIDRAIRVTDTRKFGSLRSAGPFPVCTNGTAHTWFFPRPLDGGVPDKIGTPVLRPVFTKSSMGNSSLPAPLLYPAGSTVPPTKEPVPPWWSEGAWNTYLETTPRNIPAGRAFFKKDSDFADTEHTYGIGMDPETGTTRDGQFYSAQYLRLREGWRMGAFAEAFDKEFKDAKHGRDLLKAALDRNGHLLTLGGQQRTASCHVHASSSRLPLPAGKREGFPEHNGKFLVKWILLTPGLWPQIDSHAGGWLPSWIHQESGRVLLKSGEIDRTQGEPREAWRKRVTGLPEISATLVGAVVGKAVPVTGFAMAHEAAERSAGGAKSTHLAAPAGSVYYFEADSEQEATRLADALNWHGLDLSYNKIRRLRSNLMGEKGFGLGVCGSWQFHTASI